jgi:predicted nucleic acid-binding protein
MNATLVDSNIILDVIKEDDVWGLWSFRQIVASANLGALYVNQLIFAEVAAAFDKQYELAGFLRSNEIELIDLPWEAAFLAGHTHVHYRRNGGSRERTLPDFMIGAHAQVKSFRLVSRDVQPYRSYFSDLELIAPDTHP